jgi:hypothetical protein
MHRSESENDLSDLSNTSTTAATTTTPLYIDLNNNTNTTNITSSASIADPISPSSSPSLLSSQYLYIMWILLCIVFIIIFRSFFISRLIQFYSTNLQPVILKIRNQVLRGDNDVYENENLLDTPVTSSTTTPELSRISSVTVKQQQQQQQQQDAMNQSSLAAVSSLTQRFMTSIGLDRIPIVNRLTANYLYRSSPQQQLQRTANSISTDDFTRDRGGRRKLVVQSDESDPDEHDHLIIDTSSLHHGNHIEMTPMVDAALHRHTPKLLDRRSSISHVLSSSLLQQLIPYLPSSVRLLDLTLLYNAAKDGYYLDEMYRRISIANKTQHIGSCITLIEDEYHYVFGCYTSHPFDCYQSSYYSNAECFVFQLLPEFHVYKSMKLSLDDEIAGKGNNYYMLATSDYIAVGGGSGFALWVNKLFSDGQSSYCNTFQSPVLSHSANFKLLNLELWAFV